MNNNLSSHFDGVPGTPSKSRLSEGNTTPSSSTSSSSCMMMRWILLGFGIGAATMALAQSVNMPTIRVEFEYEEGPPDLHHVQVQQGKHKHSFVLGENLAPPSQGKQQQVQQEELEAGQPEMNNRVVLDLQTPFKHEQQGAEQGHQGETEEDIMPNQAEEAQEDYKPEDPNADNTKQEVLGDVDAKGDLLSENYSDIDTNTTEHAAKIKEEDPDFSNPGPPPKLDLDDAFAACILIKDDNHWLIEWLAYHYHVMPLRYLIVAIDPDSKTSPIPILKRYKDSKRMSISIWDDAMFMPAKIHAKAGVFNNNTELMMHRVRQNNFYFKVSSPCTATIDQIHCRYTHLLYCCSA
jgi:hypothetical protein